MLLQHVECRSTYRLSISHILISVNRVEYVLCYPKDVGTQQLALAKASWSAYF